MNDFELTITCQPGSMPRAFYTAVSDKAKAYAAANKFHEAPHENLNAINRHLVKECRFVVAMNGTQIKFD